MAKTWIICIDGTWNQPGQKDRDPVTAKEEATPSNVVRTWEALANDPLAADFYYGSIAPIKPKILFTGVEGEVIYLAGIGTTGTVETHILEGATGTGTSERIRDAYRLSRRTLPPGRSYLRLRLQPRRLCDPQSRRLHRSRRYAETTARLEGRGNLGNLRRVHGW